MRGADCLLLRAYNLRMKDIILKLPEKPILDLTLCKDKWIGPMIVEVNYDNQTHTILKAEDFLKNQEWLQIANKIVDPLGIMEDSVLGREMVGYDYESSQKIQNLLTERLSVQSLLSLVRWGRSTCILLR